MAAPALAVIGLVVSYGNVRALRGVDLTLAAGEIVSVLGSNGAGKSTLLNAISGVVQAAAGAVRLGERDISRAKPWTITRLGAAHVPEGRQIFPGLTVEEHFVVARRPAEPGRREFHESDVYELFPRLYERRRQHAGNLSGGEQQMLAVGRGLLTQPRVLMLDEPSLGLAPSVTRTVFEAIATLRDDGLSILMVEQNAEAALRLSDRAYVLATGSVVAEGPSQELARSAEIRKAYLGE